MSHRRDIAQAKALIPQRGSYFSREKSARLSVGEVHDHDLTERELQVLQLIADGNTQKSAAESLKLAEITIKNKFTEIRSKLYANTTTNAVAIALRQGLID